MNVLMKTNTICCAKFYKKVASCAKLKINTLNGLLGLNLSDGPIIHLLDGLSQLNSLDDLITFKRVKQVRQSLIFKFIIQSRYVQKKLDKLVSLLELNSLDGLVVFKKS